MGRKEEVVEVVEGIPEVIYNSDHLAFNPDHALILTILILILILFMPLIPITSQGDGEERRRCSSAPTRFS